jgi:flagellar basal-body rod protein FlgB
MIEVENVVQCAPGGLESRLRRGGKVDLLGRDVTFATIAQAQRGASDRTRLLAQNIANVNTPGYKRHDLEFMDELAAALDAPPVRPREARVQDVLESTAREVVEDRLFYRVDKSGVDIDTEMAEFAKNELFKGAMSSFLADKVRMYKQVIRGGRI